MIKRRGPRFLAPDGTPDFPPALAGDDDDVMAVPGAVRAPARTRVVAWDPEPVAGVMSEGPGGSVPQGRFGAGGMTVVDDAPPAVPAPVASYGGMNPRSGENFGQVRFAPMGVDEATRKGLIGNARLQVVDGEARYGLPEVAVERGYSPNEATVRQARGMAAAETGTPVNVAGAQRASDMDATRWQRWRGGPTSVNNRAADAVLQRLAQIREQEGAQKQGIEALRAQEQIQTEEMLKRPMLQASGNVIAAWDPTRGEIVMSDNRKASGWEGISDKEVMDSYKQLALKTGPADPKDLPLPLMDRYYQLSAAKKHDEAAKILAEHGGLPEESRGLYEELRKQLQRRGLLDGGEGPGAAGGGGSRNWREKLGAGDARQ